MLFVGGTAVAAAELSAALAGSETRQIARGPLLIVDSPLLAPASAHLPARLFRRDVVCYLHARSTSHAEIPFHVLPGTSGPRS